MLLQNLWLTSDSAENNDDGIRSLMLYDAYNFYEFSSLVDHCQLVIADLL